MAVVSLKRSHERDGAIEPRAGSGRPIEVPAPQSPLDPARRSSPREIGRVDDEQREQHGDEHVAGDSHGGREHAKQRQVGAHAADVDGEERDDERQRPAAVDRCPRSLGGLDLRHQFSRPRLVREPEFVNDRLGGIGCRAHGCDDDVPGDAEDPERAGDRDDPRQIPSPGEDHEQDDGGIAERRQPRDQTFPPFMGADDIEGVTGGIDRKPAGDHDPQRLRRHERGIDEEERDRHADEGARRSVPARRGGRSSQPSAGPRRWRRSRAARRPGTPGIRSRRAARPAPAAQAPA